MDFDEVSIPGILFAVIAVIVGLIVSKGTAAGIFWKILTAGVCAVAGYFVGAKLSDG